MEKSHSFFWLVWFTRLELGGRNVALGSVSMIHLPLFGSDSKSEPASDSEAFTSATNDFFEKKSTVLCQWLLWKSHHFPISFFVFPVSFFACMDWTGCPDTFHLFSVLCSMGWGCPFLPFAVRGSQAQISASFV
jgi:hypothetical protein